MQQQLVAVDAQPCVWMCAGLVSYRLCNRDFDCEHCPLDAALRGELPAAAQGGALLYRSGSGCALPADRRYSSTHTWAQRTAETSNSWRIGIDAFAATLFASVSGISCEPFEQVRAAEPLCSIDLAIGTLTIGAPMGGRVLHHNPQLEIAPVLLLTDPYTDGWIVELRAEEDADAALLSCDVARHQLALDLRRFRRTIAFRLLALESDPSLHDRDAIGLGDLRNIIAGEHYLDCIRDFIH
jgi:glycine cleavage system H protein